jgi:hypothetical protein
VKECALSKTYYDSFLELHIEQGPLLEREGINLVGLYKLCAVESARLCAVESARLNLSCNILVSKFAFEYNLYRYSLGLVIAIAAPAALRCSFTGDGGHAGAQLMPARNDALLAAAELALAVEGFALGTGAIDTVATVGVLKVGPGAINSVPRTAVGRIQVAFSAPIAPESARFQTMSLEM